MQLTEGQACKPLGELRADLRTTLLQYLREVRTPPKPEEGWVEVNLYRLHFKGNRPTAFVSFPGFNKTRTTAFVFPEPETIFPKL